MTYVKTAPKRYFLEVIAALALMFAIVWLRQLVLRRAADPALVLLAKLLPLLPVLIIAVAVWRLYRSRDEFQQQVMLKSAAAGSFLALLIFLSYAPLHALGLPPFSRQTGLFIMAASYVLCGTVFAFLNVRAMSGTRRALVSLAPLAFLLFLPAGYGILSLFLPLPRLTFPYGMILLSAGGVMAGFYMIFVRRIEL